jgi:hypothetical protein
VRKSADLSSRAVMQEGSAVLAAEYNVQRGKWLLVRIARDSEQCFHGIVNGFPFDREQFSARRGAVFTMVERCSRSWKVRWVAGD